MSTSTTTTRTTRQSPTRRACGPRVWLVGGGNNTPDPPPDRLPVVRDDLMHIWRPGDDGQMHMATGRHHASWRDLRAHHDLVEVA